MSGRAPLWGPLAVPVTDQNFQLCPSSASHPFLPRRHTEAQRPKAGVRRPTSSLGSASTDVIPPNSSEKGTTWAIRRGPSGSNLRFKVHFQSLVSCAQPLAQSKSPINVYRKRGRQRLQPEEGLNLVENSRSPRQTGSLCTLQNVLPPARSSDNGRKSMGPKSAVHQ